MTSRLPDPPPEAERDIYTVSDLNQAVQHLLSESFPLLWIEGELSNHVRAPSGHMYFSLKDKNSQVRCAMFATKNRLLDFTPKNGQSILVRARVSLYQARGDFQLIVEDMEPRGEGALRLAYERLKKKLHQAGLFDERHKQPLPSFPQHIGIITSLTGAAIQDTLHVLARRFPQASITLYPALVQGSLAADSICQALQQAQRHAQSDALLLVRGGGSIEDLWCFNEEKVAQAIFDCPIPVISGIGHEIDFTIADFVADLRAPTPSAAAELISPDQIQLKHTLSRLENRLYTTIHDRCHATAQYLDTLWRRLLRQHPEQQLLKDKKRLPGMNQRLMRAIQQRHTQHQLIFIQQRNRLRQHPIHHRVQQHQMRLQALTARLSQALTQQLKHPQHRLQLAANALHAISPLATLGRGYALVSDHQGHIIQRATQVTPGDTLTVQLSKGQLVCSATRIQSKNRHL